MAIFRRWCVLATWALAACGPDHNETQIARGRYLAEGLLQCFVCHSERDWNAPGAPPLEGKKGAGLVWRDDGTRRLVAPNITPDSATGAGRWTDAQFARAIREGIGHDGRRLHPQMWSSSFRHLSDEDVAAVVAYLRSIPPIHNPLPRTALSTEEKARIEAMPRLAPKPQADSAMTSPVERGRHLVALADCAGCHTSWYSPRQPGLLSGGNLIERGERQAFSTNLTSHPSGVRYPAEVFIRVMRTGKNGGLSPLMPWVVFRNLSGEDLRAIHAFLQTVRPAAHYVGNTGEARQCAVCGQQHPQGELNHMEKLTGIQLDPRLYNAYTGTFRSAEYGFAITVFREGNRLFAREEDRPPAELIPQSRDRFVMDGGLAPVRFLADPEGRFARMISEEVEPVVLDRVP